METSDFRAHCLVQCERGIPQRGQRSGFTLIEMVVTFTVGSVIMLAAVTMVHRAMEIRKRTLGQMEQTRQLERVITQWRQDIHRAEAIRLADSDNCELQYLDSQVRYEISGSSLSRLVYTNNESGERPQAVARQQVNFASGVSLRFSAASEQAIAMTISEELEHRGEAKVLASVLAYCGQFSEQEDAASPAGESSHEEARQ